MKTPTATPAEIRKISQASAKLRSFDNLDTKMGAMDTQFNMVEPILTSLGWNIRDPKIVQRDPSDNLTMLITPTEGSSIAICTIKQKGSIGATKTKAASFKEASSKGADWTVITNGADYWIYHQSNTDAPFMKIKLSDDDAAQHLSFLSPKSIEQGSLKDQFDAETTDSTVKAAMEQAIGTDQFADLVRKTLSKQKTKLSKEEVAQSLARISSRDAVATKAPVGRPKKSAASAAGKSKPAAKTKPVAAKEPAAKTKPAKKSATAKTNTSDKKPASAQEWTDTATHKMVRKQNVAFIRQDAKDGTSTLLPGSLAAVKEGQTIPKAIKNMRSIALDDGSIVKKSGSYVVTREIKLDGPKSAAGFVAGTVVPNVSCWETKSGAKMPNAPKRARKSPATKAAAPVASTPGTPAQDVISTPHTEAQATETS